MRKYARCAALVVALLTLVRCGAAPAAPSTSTQQPAAVVVPPTTGGTGSTTSMAPPPAGVTAEYWRPAFGLDGLVYQPKDGEAHVVFAATDDSDTRAAFAAAVPDVVGYLGGDTPVDTVPNGKGTVITIAPGVNPGLMCDGQYAVACTTPVLDQKTGRVTSSVIEFSSLQARHDRTQVAHEVTRAVTGMVLSTPAGFCSSKPTYEPNAQERIMLPARMHLNPLTVFTDK